METICDGSESAAMHKPNYHIVLQGNNPAGLTPTQRLPKAQFVHSVGFSNLLLGLKTNMYGLMIQK